MENRYDTRHDRTTRTRSGRARAEFCVCVGRARDECIAPLAYVTEEKRRGRKKRGLGAGCKLIS